MPSSALFMDDSLLLDIQAWWGKCRLDQKSLNQFKSIHTFLILIDTKFSGTSFLHFRELNFNWYDILGNLILTYTNFWELYLYNMIILGT